ncbi:MAG: hypothetical protein HY321_16200 [Armatimonadetes bacterium]|nr:hypothetical protein [Armatimonadota bacterium]
MKQNRDPRRSATWRLAGRAFVRAMALLGLMACAPLAFAASITENYTDPDCRQEPTSAYVDGTARTFYVFTCYVEVPDNERIGNYNWNTYRWVGDVGYVYLSFGGAILHMMPISVNSRGQGFYRASVPGLFWRGDNDLPAPLAPLITYYAQSLDISQTPPVLTGQVSADGYSPVISGRGREVLVPVDATGKSDQFKPAKKAGGVTVLPADTANYGDGSGSATYVFRVMYRDPDGLPPRPDVPSGGRFDRVSSSLSSITTGMELDQYNVPRRSDDPWRFVKDTDATIPTEYNPAQLPAGAQPRPWRSGVYVVFDDNNDGAISTNPMYWGWGQTGAPQPWRNANLGDSPRLMVIDTDLQPQFRTRDPNAAEWYNGVIFKYSVRATDHSVSTGIPSFFDFGAAANQFLLMPFALNPGQKYLNTGRGNDLYGWDPTTRSFVSLPAGLRRYTFLTSNDICYGAGGIPDTGSLGAYSTFGYYPGLDGYARNSDPYANIERYFGLPANTWRFFQQPGLNAPKIDPQSPPSKVFYPPFEVQVDPQITVEQTTLQGYTPLMLVGIPTPVHGREIVDPNTGAVSAVERTLYADDVHATRPTRFTVRDQVQWRFYYTQSRGLAPSIAEMVLLKDAGGSWVPVSGSPFPCQQLATGTAGRDPIYAQFPDPSHINPFYGQYGVSLNMGSAQLGPGVYRYYFRASDDRRMAEWPGDSGADTSLARSALVDHLGSAQMGVSHVSNTVRVNTKPTLGSATAQATVDPKTGAISWTVEVIYADADGDAPSQPLLIFPAATGTTDPDLTLVMQKDPTSNNFATGVKYSFTSATDPTVGAFGGRRSYRFAFTDNWKTANNQEPGEMCAYQDPAGSFLNSQPFLVSPSVDKARGSIGMEYTFSVRYGDNEGDAPQRVNGVDQVQLLIDGNPTSFYLRTAETTPDYSKGVLYSVKVGGRDIGAGAHAFAFRATDDPGQVAGMTSTSATMSGPTIDTPVLSDPSVTGTPSIAGTPVAGSVATDWVFRVRYRHASNVAPTYVVVKLFNPDGTLLRDVTLTQDPPANPSDTIVNPGLFYSNMAAPVRFGAPGLYQYYFETADGESVRQLMNGAANFQGPLVAAPALTAQPVDPVTGVIAVPFKFSVLYKHAGGVQPPANGVQLQIISPSGAAQTITMALQDAANRTPAELPGTGWPYIADNVALTEVGTYRYAFSATDGATRVETPLAEGPTAVAVEQPVLSEAAVSLVPGEASRVTYSLRYKQTQRLTPTIQLIRPNLNPEPLTHQISSGTDITQGVVFAVTLPKPEPAIPYYFLVRVPGLSPIRYPQTDLVGPNVAPQLAAPEGGTVNPKSGHTGTKFQFRVLVTDVDSTSDPEVSVNVGGKRLPMTRLSGSVATGAVFGAEAVLPTGSLLHSFAADDGTDTAGLSVQGPTVLPQTTIHASVVTAPVPLDGTTPIQLAGALEPAVPSAELTATYTDPSGATVKRTAYTGSDGRFTDSLVPNFGGAWKVKVEYAGTETIGGGVTDPELSVTVTPQAVALGPGLHLIGVPVTPADGTLAGILTGGAYGVARWNGTQYDYGAGAVGTVVPGIGFWVNATTPVQAVPAGRTVNHTQAQGVRVVSGWNQLANPFLGAVSFNRMTLETASGTMLLPEAMRAAQAMEYGWVYDPGTSQYLLVHPTLVSAQRSILPWQGFWFKSNVEGRLVFAPPARSAAPEAVADRRRDRRSDREWQIQLVAGNGRQVDSHNYAGVTSQGRAASHAAIESPPPIGYYVDLHFTGSGEGRLATDFRAPSAGEQAWDMVVETNVGDRAVTVSVPNLSGVPHNLDVLLEDQDAGGRRVYLRTSGGYTFNPGESMRRRLRLIVRPRTEGALQISDVVVTQTRGGVAIGYVVSRDALVTVEVLSPAGKRLSLVADRQAAPQGRSSVAWDGTRADGARLPAGIYLVQVTAATAEGSSARTIKPVAITR